LKRGWTPSVPTRFDSLCRFDADAIIHGLPESLFASQVALGRLYRYVPQQELNLFQLAASGMAESGA
jgi:hypothetical protein